MENQELVNRIEDLFYTRAAGQSRCGYWMEHEREEDKKVYTAIDDGTLLKRINERQAEECWAIDNLPGQVERLEDEQEDICQRTKSGYLVGHVHNKKYYPSRELAGESLEKCVHEMGQLYSSWHQKTTKHRNRIGTCAIALNAPGIAAALIPTAGFAYLLERSSPSNGTSGGLGLMILVGGGLACVGTVATTAALTYFAGPIGLAYGAAALGSVGAYFYGNEKMPKELEAFSTINRINCRQKTLKNNLNNILDEGKIFSWSG